MGYEDAEPKEITPSSSSISSSSSSNMTLQKAIELGEYLPEFLSTFAE